MLEGKSDEGYWEMTRMDVHSPSLHIRENASRFQNIHFKGHKVVPRPRSSGGSSNAGRPTGHTLGQSFGTMVAEESEEIQFARDVLTAAGLDPRGYRAAPLIRRLPACLRALRANSISSARGLIQNDPQKLTLATNALLIGTTSFFRDAFVFDEVENWVIPRIISRTDSPRVWSVACSEGAELYSVAMLFSRHVPLHQGRFLGTDCRDSAIQSAIKGVYQPLPEEISGRNLDAMFQRNGIHTRVHPALASAIEWRCSDFFNAPVEQGWDMILCRNLAIYLEPPAMDTLWKSLAGALHPGGFLVVGRAEKPHVPELQRVAPCIYQKISSR